MSFIMSVCKSSVDFKHFFLELDYFLLIQVKQSPRERYFLLSRADQCKVAGSKIFHGFNHIPLLFHAIKIF